MTAATDINYLRNWSDSHRCYPRDIYTPQSLQEVEQLVELHHTNQTKIRCVGSGLSPNGLGFASEIKNGALINLARMDRILNIDHQTRLVTVESGIIVGDLIKKLRPHGLTLTTIASIREQQIGGVTQAGCHGTGASIAPFEEQIEELEIVTPGKGTLVLNKTRDAKLFQMAKCGVGIFGVVTKIVLQCIPAYQLREEIQVLTRKSVSENHASRMLESLHLRYMWIPYTDAVVVVSSKVITNNDHSTAEQKTDEHEYLEEARRLYCELKGDNREDLENWSFTTLRDKLLCIDNLNHEHVKRVNAVEAEYWRACQGSRTGFSDEILGFDCGGQQLVLEVAFPCGKGKIPDNTDLQFVEHLLQKIEEQRIPAPAPIEQRWTASSSATLSPASGPSHVLFSWVGIVQYLPSPDAQLRNHTMDVFHDYSQLLLRHMEPYGAIDHWAKIEIPRDSRGLKALRDRMRQRYPVAEILKYQALVDPASLLTNEIIEAVFGFENNEGQVH